MKNLTLAPRRTVVSAATESPALVRAERAATAAVSLDLIERLYREHAARYRRVAFAVVLDAQVAEDVVQDAFARAVVRRDSFRASGDAAAWLWRIVVNTAISRRRRAKLERRALELLRLAPDRADASTGDRLGELVAGLPERQRAAVFLRYYADLDYAAIADALAIAPGTVGKLLHDARARIREVLHD
jgi:RNA polymerase sigma-70 factor (ECF subfamily)